MRVPENKLIPCRCASQFCGDCSLSAMVAWRERLRPACEKWRDASMVTLTVDPEAFNGPQEAWEYVGENRSISLLCQSLRRKKLVHGPEYFYALEFHQSGWPHWHLVLHAGFIPFEVVRDIWGLGHTWISRTKSMKSVNHAIHYATKYVAKPDASYPDWVLHYQGNIRRFSTSRGLCPLPRCAAKKKNGKPRHVRTIAQRLAGCAQKTKVIQVVDIAGGKRGRHVKTYDVPFDKTWRDRPFDESLQEVAAIDRRVNTCDDNDLSENKKKEKKLS